MFSDASGRWGCGAYCNGHWFQFQWPNSMEACHISSKEMIPIVMAAMVWGGQWEGLSVRFHTDNSAVVALLNSGSVRDESLMHLMRCSHLSQQNSILFSQLATLLKQGCIYTPQKVYSVRFKNYPPWGVNWGS